MPYVNPLQVTPVVGSLSRAECALENHALLFACRTTKRQPIARFLGRSALAWSL